jgi:hypothetical protein
METTMSQPPSFDPFHYYRDHADSGAWGVRDARSGTSLAVGLDKSIAAAIACLLNGEVSWARSLLEYLPPRLPPARLPAPPNPPPAA